VYESQDAGLCSWSCPQQLASSWMWLGFEAGGCVAGGAAMCESLLLRIACMPLVLGRT